VSAARRRLGSWTLVMAAGLLVVVLVGGRWLAQETAERAWAATLPAGTGAVYLSLRGMARLISGGILLLAVSWGVLNVYFVYRSIGSVQMPRRLGDLEIVEAVPQPVLLAITLAAGGIFGVALAWGAGTGGWWRQVLLAAAPPHFGTLDPELHNDVGYYLAGLPWAHTRQQFALLASVTALVLVALLYAGIGSLRFTHGRPVAGPHARGHLGLLLTCAAAAIAWGALLDPAEVVAGMHGAFDHTAQTVRLPGAPVVAVLAVAAGVASFAWAWRDRATLLAGTWTALMVTMVGVYFLLPAIARGARGGDRATPLPHLAERARLERLAFGADALTERTPPALPDVARALAAMPLWDPGRIAATVKQGRALGAHASVAAVALSAGTALPPRWLVAPAPDDSSLATLLPQPSWDDVHRGPWASTGAPLLAVEADSGLALQPLPAADAPPPSWFGPGFGQFALSDSSGIPLDGRWRRLAFAWTLQSPELARDARRGARLLWRRDVRERLLRLAPFAAFDPPVPALAGRALWWLAYGYVDAETFPLVDSLRWADHLVRYRRAGLLGGVNAATGDTRLWLAPGTDSLSAAWARLFAPLVQPAESIPGEIRARLPYPDGAFRIAAASLQRMHGDSIPWTPRPAEPFVLAAPRDAVAGGGGPAQWTGQAFESGGAGTATVSALLAGGMDPSAGPRLFLWRLDREPSPAPVLGDAGTRPGTLRLWPLGGVLLALQPLFAQPIGEEAAPRIETVYLTVGDRPGMGATREAALQDLLAAGPLGTPADTTLRGAWREAQHLATRADSLLKAGDLEQFAQAYRRLSGLLARRKLARAP
jgi:uncharacterized membrane protein (UPF0182 family)